MTGATPPLRLGVIGCGRVFERHHLKAITRTPGMTLVAACDPEPSRLAWARARTPAVAAFQSVVDLVGYPDLEAVLILTPPERHAEATVRALEAGLHVLVEKPMALSSQEARRMTEAARLGQRRLQVGFNRRFREPNRRLREKLSALDRGQLRALRYELTFPTGSWDARSGFLGDDSRGGGVFDDVVSHQVDLICWLLGAAPDQVKASVRNAPVGGVSAHLKFGSLLAHCDAAHGSYVERIEVELEHRRLLEASGSRLSTSSTRFPALRRSRALIQDRVGHIGRRLLGRTTVTLESFERQLRDFERGVRGLGFHGASGEEGALTVDIVEACRKSVENGGSWQPLRRSAIPVA